jgi:hypothetical protein
MVTRGRRCSGVPSDSVPAFYTSSVNLSSITLTDPDATQPLGVTGTSQVVRDTIVSLFSAGGTTATNKTAVDALCKQLFQDFADWRSNSFDICYNGVIALVPNGLIDVIEWRYDAENQVTRITSQPWNGEPEEFQHMDPSVAGCTDASNSGNPVGKVPYVSFIGGPESCTGGKATATCTVVSGAVSTVTVTAGGTYTGTPTVAFSQRPGDGKNATATATVAGGAVTTVAVNTGGTGYSAANPPIVSFHGGGASLERVEYLLALEDGRLWPYFVRYLNPS